MEEIIRKIVDADKQARARVEQKQQERHNIQNLIQDQSMEIREKYRKGNRRLYSKEARTDGRGFTEGYAAGRNRL